MDSATITSKSQITLPKSVREALGADVGDKIMFVPARNGFRLVVVKTKLEDLAGMFKGRRKEPLSMDAMNRTIAQMGSRPERDD